MVTLLAGRRPLTVYRDAKDIPFPLRYLGRWGGYSGPDEPLKKISGLFLDRFQVTDEGFEPNLLELRYR